jgi:hypothetical protein
MRFLATNIRKFTLFSLICLAFVISACASGGVTPPPDLGNGDGNTGIGSDTTPTAQPGDGQTGSSSVVFAGIEISIVSVDQQNKYVDDDYGDKAWTLRINVKERNVVDETAYLYYNDILRLTLPNGSNIAPQKVNGYSGIDQQVVRDNWYDFALDQKQDVTKLVLHIGEATDYQYTVPLSSNPDLSKYAAKNITPNNKVSYGGVDWTVTKVTSQYYYKSQQATAGHRYIVVTLSADNTGKDAFYPFPNDTFRLKTPNVTQGPESSTLPSYIDAGSNGATGVVVFLIPEGDTDLTLKFLARPNDQIQEATTSFKI